MGGVKVELGSPGLTRTREKGGVPSSEGCACVASHPVPGQPPCLPGALRGSDNQV